MPSQQEQLIKEIQNKIDDAITSFNENIPQLQQNILSDIVLLIKELDVDSSGGIKNSVSNLRLVGRIKVKLNEAILNDDYLKKVSDFVKIYDDVSALQNQYFNLIERTFTPSKLLAEIQKQAIDSTIVSLTEAGIGSNITEEIQNMLRINVTSGGMYSDLVSQLRGSIISNQSGQGLLEKYVSQVTIDSIHQFNAQYTAAISDDLNLSWAMYTGSIIDSSREFCIHLTKKKFVHKSELSTIVDGMIDGYQVKINPRTKLWYGAVENTNVFNFPTYRGGYRCAHFLQPVSSAIVPANLRAMFPQ